MALALVTGVMTARWLGPYHKGTLSTLLFAGQVVLFHLSAFAPPVTKAFMRAILVVERSLRRGDTYWCEKHRYRRAEGKHHPPHSPARVRRIPTRTRRESFS